MKPSYLYSIQDSSQLGPEAIASVPSNADAQWSGTSFRHESSIRERSTSRTSSIGRQTSSCVCSCSITVVCFPLLRGVYNDTATMFQRGQGRKAK
jgi:hypothetical protein